MFLKKWLLLSVMISLLVPAVFAQEDEGSGKKDDFSFQGPGDGSGFSQVSMPFGYTRIGDKDYISFRIQPEFSFGKFGIGLDVPFLYSPADGKFRWEEYKGGVGPLRLIRYVRYGVKHVDPVYARVGDISGSSLGYGLTMYNYSNAVSFEKRKWGLNYDLNYDLRFGVEGVYSDFDGFNIFGIRPYARPLKTSEIPVLKTMEVGVTYITDQDKEMTFRGITEIGADLGITVFQNSFVQILPYMEFAKILKNDDLSDSVKALNDGGADITYKSGQGFAYGVNFRFNFVADVFNMGIKLERRMFSNDFVPQYFNALYEVSKDGRAMMLPDAKGQQGSYGEIFANLIGKVQIIGGISIPDKMKKTRDANIHLGLVVPKLIPKVIISGSYDKAYLKNLGAAFTFNQHSVANMRFAYEAYQTGPFVFMTGVDYKWTFVKAENGLKAKKYITPYVGMMMNMPWGDQKK